MDNNRSSRYKIPGLVLLQTDETEPELLYKNTVCNPDGDRPGYGRPCVFFRMRYEAPLKPFTGIKKLILAIRRKTGLQSGFHGAVGIDVSPWKGHEEEEYFQILLKYLYDNSGEWDLTFICSNYTGQEFLNLQYHCVSYFMIESRQICLYPPGILESSIRRTFTELRQEIEPDAVDILAAAIRSCSGRISGLPQKLPRIACEITRLSGNGWGITSPGKRAAGGIHFPTDKSAASGADFPTEKPEAGSGIFLQQKSADAGYDGRNGDSLCEERRKPSVSAKMVSSYVDDPQGFLGLLRNMTGCTLCPA